MGTPNFLCIGAQKAGTTLLFDILRRHPDIYLPDSKELHFFDRDEECAKGLAWYQDTYFRGSDNHRCVGEVTPSYIFFENAPERIFRALGPDLKILVSLRHPVDRACSHYWMQFKRGLETKSFMKALTLEQARIGRGYWDKSRFSYISRGFYAQQIKRYLKYFPLGNMKFIFFEELVRDLPGTIRDIIEFLGCDPDRLPDSAVTDKINSSRLTLPQYLKAVILNWPYVAMPSFRRAGYDYPPLKIKYQNMILGKYRDDLRSLQSLINRDLGIWRSGGNGQGNPS